MDGPSPHVPRGHLRANVQAAAPGAEPVLPLLGAALPAQLCHRAQHARLSDQARRVHGREHQLPALPIAPPGLQGAPGPVLPVGGPPPVAFPDPSRSAASRLRRECAPGPWRLPGAGEAHVSHGQDALVWALWRAGSLRAHVQDVVPGGGALPRVPHRALCERPSAHGGVRGQRGGRPLRVRGVRARAPGGGRVRARCLGPRVHARAARAPPGVVRGEGVLLSGSFLSLLFTFGFFSVFVVYFQVPFCLCCLFSGSPHSRVCVRCSTFKFPLY